MTEPPPFARRCGIPNLLQRNVPLMLVRMTPVETVDIEGVDLAEDAMAAPGIVVQNIELAEAADHSIRHRFDAGGVAYIAREELGVASLRAN
jgi:hypothetical protein